MPGKIIKVILALIEDEISNASDLMVSGVRVGSGYTGVALNDGNVGVCHTLSYELVCCQRIDRAGRLAGSPALEIAWLANS